jgi:hypothetical protein
MMNLQSLFRIGSINLFLFLSISANADIAPEEIFANIVSPQHLGLQDGLIEVAIHVICDADDSWQLRSYSYNSAEELILSEGFGPTGPAEVVFSGQVPFGFQRLTLDLVCGEIQETDSIDLTYVPQMVAGWPFNPSGNEDIFHAMPEKHGENLAFSTFFSGIAGNVHLLSATGENAPGFPVDIETLGINIFPGSTPLSVDIAGTESIIVAGEHGLISLDSAGQILNQCAFTQSCVSPPVILNDADGGQRVIVFSTVNKDLVLLAYDLELNLLNEICVNDFIPVKEQAPVIVDFDGDGSREIMAAGSFGNSTRIVSFANDLLSATILYNFEGILPANFIAGEIDGDFNSDLILGSVENQVVAIDYQGVKWVANLPGKSLGAVALIDIDNDKQQEVAFVSYARGDDTVLHLFNGAGQENTAFQVNLGSTRKAVGAPLAVSSIAEGSVTLIIALEEYEDVNLPGRIALINSDGELQDWQYYLTGRPTASPLVVDIDGNDILDLLVADSFGYLMAWPLDIYDAFASHPLGGKDHANNFMQPFYQDENVTTTLSGNLLFADQFTFVSSDSLNCRDLTLYGGALEVNGMLSVSDHLTIADNAEIHFGPAASISGSIQLDLSGIISVLGTRSNQSNTPAELTSESNLFNSIHIKAFRGSSISLTDCNLNHLDRNLNPGPEVAITLSNCGLLQGAGSVEFTRSPGQIDHCLFMGTENAIELHDQSTLVVSNCIFTDIENIAISNQTSDLTMNSLTFIGGGTGVLHSNGQTQTDSCHFQGNSIDIHVISAAENIQIRNSDFVDAVNISIINDSSEDLIAGNCFWNSNIDFSGPVLREPMEPTTIFPLVVPVPVFNLEPGPMVDGDEPLEWEVVDISLNGIPLSVTYCIYRSSNAYDVIRPENLVAITQNTWWFDQQHHDRAFYRVTTSFGVPPEVGNSSGSE